MMKPTENWGSGGPYEQYVGRWSRKVAEEFLTWRGASLQAESGVMSAAAGLRRLTNFAREVPAAERRDDSAVVIVEYRGRNGHVHHHTNRDRAQ